MTTTIDATRKMALVTGNTFTVKESLKRDGWKWVPECKGWTKDVNAEWDARMVEMDIRDLSGVRNRLGKVEITFPA
jgi:hypothetical protein